MRNFTFWSLKAVSVLTSVPFSFRLDRSLWVTSASIVDILSKSHQLTDILLHEIQAGSVLVLMGVQSWGVPRSLTTS